MSEPFRTMLLENGLLISFYDLSNRYYGDFHRVLVKLSAEIPVSKLTLPTDLLPAKSKLPEILRFEKSLQKMGVKTADLEPVRLALVDDFINNTVQYLQTPIFLERLLQKNMQEELKKSKVLSW